MRKGFYFSSTFPLIAGQIRSESERNFKIFVQTGFNPSGLLVIHPLMETCFPSVGHHTGFHWVEFFPPVTLPTRLSGIENVAGAFNFE